MNPRHVTWVLLLLLGLLQFPLWFGKGGYFRVRSLQEEVQALKASNEQKRVRNAQLEGEVRSLSQGVDAVEERARHGFNLVKEGEYLIEFIEDKPGASTSIPLPLQKKTIHAPSQASSQKSGHEKPISSTLKPSLNAGAALSAGQPGRKQLVDKALVPSSSSGIVAD